MIIKFTIPCGSGDKIKRLKEYSNLLLRLTQYQLIIEEVDYYDDSYAGIIITTTKGEMLFSYFKPVSELAYPELDDYMLRLLKKAISFTSNYIRALAELDLEPIKNHFKKLNTVLIFIQNQIELDV
jgi:hypothetical protein